MADWPENTYLRYFESRDAVALYGSRSIGGTTTNAMGVNSLE